MVRLRPSAPSTPSHGDVAQSGRAPRLQRGRCGFESHRLHCFLDASVVSTASTRPLYGRGAGSTPAGGSRTTNARSSVERALLCDGRGRWFDSSRACFTRMELRGKSAGAPPRRGPFDPGRPLTDSWCNGAWRAPTSLVRVRILASLLSRAGAARLSIGRAAFGPWGSSPRTRPRATTATT